MKIRYCTPTCTDRNLARAYNEEIKLSEMGGYDYTVFRDRDTIILDAYYAQRIERIISLHGEAFYTCYTNRVNCKWQVAPTVEWTNSDMEYHKTEARVYYDTYVNEVEDRTSDQLWSGFFMIIPTSKWEPLEEKETLLGVDNDIHRVAQKSSKILLMKGIYIYHDYRGGNRADKDHLK